MVVLAVTIDLASRPRLRTALVANKIQDAVCDNSRVEQKRQEVAPCPRLAKIADAQIDHKAFLDGAEHHGFEAQPGAEGRDYHQHPNSKDHDAPVPQGRHAGRRIVDETSKHRREQVDVDRDRQ
jgi:hypothetical protein